jgi:hypothetical protein
MARKNPFGHYCRVCGERKANEKFSGTGHAAHICKACAALPVPERNALQAINKIEGMAMRHISDSEITWLRNHLNDPRLEVQQAAREVHHLKLQRYERGQVKKGLTVLSLEFYLRGEAWDAYVNTKAFWEKPSPGGLLTRKAPVHARIFADPDGVFRLVDYAQETEAQVVVEKHIAQKFLKSLIHEWDVLFWDEDLSDSSPKDEPYLDDMPGYRDFDDEEDDEGVPQKPETTPQGNPIWFVKLKMNKGKNKEIVFYNQLYSEAQELYWALISFFEPDYLEDELMEAPE